MSDHPSVPTYLASRRMNPGSILSAASRGLLNPLPPPGRRLEGIPEILCFVDDLAVAELHNTHRVCQSSLVRDCVFRDPEIPVSENSLDSGVSDGHLRGRQPALEALRSNQGTENSLLKLILLPRICFHVFRRHRLMMTYLPASLMPADASRFRFQIQEKTSRSVRD